MKTLLIVAITFFSTILLLYLIIRVRIELHEDDCDYCDGNLSTFDNQKLNSDDEELNRILKRKNFIIKYCKECDSIFIEEK